MKALLDSELETAVQVMLLDRSQPLPRDPLKKVADDVALKAGISRQDVFINLVEVSKENWSFGNGEMQYMP